MQSPINVKNSQGEAGRNFIISMDQMIKGKTSMLAGVSALISDTKSPNKE